MTLEEINKTLFSPQSCASHSNIMLKVLEWQSFQVINKQSFPCSLLVTENEQTIYHKITYRILSSNPQSLVWFALKTSPKWNRALQKPCKNVKKTWNHAKMLQKREMNPGAGGFWKCSKNHVKNHAKMLQRREMNSGAGKT